MMGNKRHFPHTVLVEPAVEHTPLVKRVLARLPAESEVVVTDEVSLLQGRGAQGVLVLAAQRGHFVKPCPGTKEHICCGYLNLNVASGCTMGCHYCILQSYLGQTHVTFFANTDQLWHELDRLLSRRQGRVVRIGTGELIDSLLYDDVVGLNAELVRYFADKKGALFELKTKSDRVDSLLGLDHGRRTVLSWSLNSEAMVAAHEPHAASLENRLKAARLAQEAGYRLGFHFDPLIWYEGWQQGYAQVVEQLLAFARPENIAWISLGALRYPAAMDELLRTRHPQCDLPLGELLPGKDGKFRYFRALREQMFGFLYRRIREHAPEVPVYLCMESDVVWRRALGWSPGSTPGLAQLLDQQASR